MGGQRGPDQGGKLLTFTLAEKLGNELGGGGPDAQIEKTEVAHHDPGERQEAKAVRTEVPDYVGGGGHADQQRDHLPDDIQNRVAGENLAANV